MMGVVVVGWGGRESGCMIEPGLASLLWSPQVVCIDRSWLVSRPGWGPAEESTPPWLPWP